MEGVVAVEETNESSFPLSQSPIRFDLFELDPQTGNLRRGGLTVDLSPQLSKLLLMLTQRPGGLVTRKQIKKALWSDQSYGDFEGRLNLTVEKLRAALGDNDDQPRYIQTVRNAGYRFIAPLREARPRPFVVSDATDHSPARYDTVSSGVAPEHKGVRIRVNEFLLVLLTVLVLAVAGTTILATRKGEEVTARPPSPSAGDSRPEIASVTPIFPQRTQGIVINGHGFGSHTPYAHTDSPYLAIRDLSGNWMAGRIIPENHDAVTVDVDSWTDTEIALSGFSGDYGKNGWKLNPGDNLEIAIWNPQSGAGPTLFNLRVSDHIP